MRLHCVLLAGCLFASACDTKPAEPVTNGREVVREGLLDGSNCYGNTPLLCIEDES